MRRLKTADTLPMDFITVWSAKEWTPEEALTIAVEAVNRSGRHAALVEWADPDGTGVRDFYAVADENNWSATDAVAMIIAYGDESGFARQLDAHARRYARKNPPDPDHYGD